MKRKIRIELQPVQALGREGVFVRAVWKKGRRKGSLVDARRLRRRLEKLFTESGYMSWDWQK